MDYVTEEENDRPTDDRYVLVDGERIDAAALLWAMYHLTIAPGLGILHDKPGFTLDDARAVLDERAEYGFVFDYVYGRPIKVCLERDEDGRSQPYRAEVCDRSIRLYERDAGPGAFEFAVENARKAMEEG